MYKKDNKKKYFASLRIKFLFSRHNLKIK